ncbi:unnamed protein product, partial [marine sediment metagenome]
ESPLSYAFLSSHLLFEHLPDSRRPRGRYRELTCDKKSLVVNDSLTLAGIAPEVLEYRLCNATPPSPLCVSAPLREISGL